jgi:hypothetical protein
LEYVGTTRPILNPHIPTKHLQQEFRDLILKTNSKSSKKIPRKSKNKGENAQWSLKALSLSKKAINNK